jgi:hypothetical protein
MEKISIKNLIDFRRKSEVSQKTFVNNLKKDKQSEKGSGGDYWISSLSTISNVYKTGESNLLDEKREILQDKINASDVKTTKTMFQRNIDILHNFEDYDLENIKPDVDFDLHKKPDNKSLIIINGLPIQAKPHHVFSFTNGEIEEIGAVWFIAKLEGFSESELGMFTDIMWRYLDKHFSKDFVVNPDYCNAVDVMNGKEVSYTQILKGEVPVLLEKTIDEINAI